LQRYFKWAKKLSAHTLYYLFFVLLIVINAILLPFGQPFLFLVTSAVLGGAVMAIYTPILLYINNTRLPKEIRPSFITNVVLVLATIFFSYFSFIVFLGYLT
jgi:Mn2+/Fe2+ NRAMP family transporter